MRNFTQLLKTLLFLVIATAAASTAKANPSWYAYSNEVVATPTGAGQVYASDPSLNESYDDVVDWTDDQYVEIVAQTGNLNCYAKPADGWLFAGWTRGVVHEDGTYEYSDNFISSTNPASVSLQDGVTDDPSGNSSDSSVVAGMMPLDPNNVIYGNFARVIAQYYPGQSSLGTFTVSPLSNNYGDVVTLTAEPADGATFDGWMLNGQYVSTSSEYTITVTDTARYVPHFSAPNAWDVDFGNGRAVALYPGDSADISVPDGFRVIEFFTDSMRTGYYRSTFGLYSAISNVPAMTPAVVVGKGKGTFVRSTNYYPYADDNNIGRWTENGVNVDDLDTDHSYYTFDAATSQLHLVAPGTQLPAQSLYIALPDSTWDGSKQVRQPGETRLSAAPPVIYTSNEAAIATAIKAVRATGKRDVLKGIYTLDGSQLKALDHEGIFIVDGKKVVYKKK